MKPEVTPAGRSDYEDFLGKSGIRSEVTLKHYPILVFKTEEESVVIEIWKSLKDLVEKGNYAPNTWCMAQWAGQWRSDFFKFTIKEMLEYLETHPKSDYQII